MVNKKYWALALGGIAFGFVFSAFVEPATAWWWRTSPAICSYNGGVWGAGEIDDSDAQILFCPITENSSHRKDKITDFQIHVYDRSFRAGADGRFFARACYVDATNSTTACSYYDSTGDTWMGFDTLAPGVPSEWWANDRGFLSITFPVYPPSPTTPEQWQHAGASEVLGIRWNGVQ